ANEPIQAGPSSTRSVRPATAASSVNASRRRLTNSASPHQTESITGHASTASASARRSRALQSPTGMPRVDSAMPKFISYSRTRLDPSVRPRESGDPVSYDDRLDSQHKRVYARL